MNYKDLQFYMEKRLQTTMIGAIARMEENFGFLWGHDKENITAKEEEFLDIWEFTRNQILNYGNNQLRNIGDDFDNFFGKKKIIQEKYHYNFPVKKRNDNLKRKDDYENR